MTLLLYIHIVTIAGEFSKARNEPVTYLGTLSAENLYRSFTVGHCFLQEF